MKPIIVFDFDGVIVLGSERIKQKSWLEVFESRGSDAITFLKRAVERHAEGRGSRYEIVHDVLDDLGTPQGSMDELLEFYCGEYAQKVKKGVLTEGVRAEDRKALDFLFKKASLFVNTATPRAAMEEILKKLRIDNLFQGVYGPDGSALKKADILKIIADREARAVKDIIFIGDGEGDRKAALDVGCLFIGIGNDNNRWTEDKQDFMVVSSVFEATANLFPDFRQD